MTKKMVKFRGRNGDLRRSDRQIIAGFSGSAGSIYAVVSQAAPGGGNVVTQPITVNTPNTSTSGAPNVEEWIVSLTGKVHLVLPQPIGGNWMVGCAIFKATFDSSINNWGTQTFWNNTLAGSTGVDQARKNWLYSYQVAGSGVATAAAETNSHWSMELPAPPINVRSIRLKQGEGLMFQIEWNTAFSGAGISLFAAPLIVGHFRRLY